MSSNRITILHDSFGRPSALRQEWGFAALIEHEGLRILFDTGNSARTFADNTATLGVDLRQLDCAVISHRHGDHTSGLNHLLAIHPRLQIYTPDETYGVFGSSLPGTFFPSCHSLPAYMRYYEGRPPDVITHGSPWPDARFEWIQQTTELRPSVFALPTVSDLPGTRELRELSLALRTPVGLVLVVGCSHPGIEKIVAAAQAIEPRIACIVGGLHLLLTEERELRRVARALRDDWRVERIAPGHCTGEPGFAVLQQEFGNNYLFAGLGETITLV